MDLKWLAEQLNRPGYSQAGLARALGKSPSAVSRILSGDRQIKLQEAAQILAYLGVPAPAASEDAFASYHYALGEAVARWNDVEVFISWTLAELTPEVSGLAQDLIFLLYQAIGSRTPRLEAIDKAVRHVLQDNRNAQDAWVSLFTALSRAGKRRDSYVHATADDQYGQVVGRVWASDRVEHISISQLREDAAQFQELVIRLNDFHTVLRKAVAKTADKAKTAKE